MKDRINVAELLRNCPKGMELDCTMFENAIFVRVDMSKKQFPIEIAVGGIHSKYLTKEGCFHDTTLLPESKCVIFPKGKTTWEGFQRPFEDGDILSYTSSHTTVFIHRNKDNEPKHTTSFYVGYTIGKENHNFHIYHKTMLIALNEDCEVRFATEEERQKLFQAIKDNGYMWNSETKTLEKLIEPRFKVGDKIVDILRKHVGASGTQGIISEITDDKYIFTDSSYISIKDQDNWELVSDKFDITTLKPFESKVLVRNDEHQYWIPAFWGCKRSDGYTTTFGWCKYCIPYEGNEHLFETNNDCDEIFKTWK